MTTTKLRDQHPSKVIEQTRERLSQEDAARASQDCDCASRASWRARLVELYGRTILVYQGIMTPTCGSGHLRWQCDHLHYTKDEAQDCTRAYMLNLYKEQGYGK